MLMLSLAASEDATQKFKTSTNLCVYMQGARRVEGVAVWVGVLYHHSFQHCFSPFTCEWSCSLNIVLSFLPPEHSGRGEVHPGPDEPHARPEHLLQPVPGDGLRQAKRVQGHLQHGLQVTLCSVIFGEGS